MKTLTAACASLAVLVISTVALADGTMSAEGAKTPKFGAEKIIGITYKVETPRDIATGQASGKRRHGAACVIKPTSSSTPLYFNALATNEVLKVVNLEVNGLKIKLTNATLTSFSLPQADGRDVEELCFSFQNIELSKGGSVARDGMDGRS
jgi:type VI secretion system secreted protein Hcp